MRIYPHPPAAKVRDLLGKVGLLRSLAVKDAARGHGCGSELVKEAERHAAANGVEALYLLTTTAEEFFRSQGYVEMERASLPDAIQRTKEFSMLCPSSSVAMVKYLKT